MAKTEGQGSPTIDDRQVARPVAPPEKPHRHRFEVYEAGRDLWVCRS
jgi:hypothetical protein